MACCRKISVSRRLAAAALAGMVAAAAPARALSPAEVFEKVAPSVWAVRGLDAQERPISYGSAVVIGAGRLITNCHVLAKAKAIQVRRENMIYEAKLEFADVERDLCQMTVANFAQPAVPIVRLDQLKVGQRVYAIGNPEKLALTLSEGLISGLRSEDAALPPVQTSAAISPGSSGGGLFDESGRLVGITTLAVVGRLRIAQNLNFAVPAEWIAEVPERAKVQLAKRRERSQQAASRGIGPASGLPAVGASWKYSYRDQRFSGPERLFTISVTSVDGTQVRESMAIDGGGSSSLDVNAAEVAFNARRLGSDTVALELAPYYYSSALARASAEWMRPMRYSTYDYKVSEARVDTDEVSVPGGSFKAVRVNVTGEAVQFGSPGPVAGSVYYPARFEYTAWYSAEVNRYVMARHRTYNRYGRLVSDELVQLVQYKHN